MRTKKTDKRVPEDGNDHQDFVPFIENNVEGESTPIESAETEHEKKGGKETKEATTATPVEDEKEVTANGDMMNALVAVCENDEEKRVAALSEDQMSLELEAKLKAGDIDGSVTLGTLWLQLHGRALKKNLT